MRTLYRILAFLRHLGTLQTKGWCPSRWLYWSEYLFYFRVGPRTAWQLACVMYPKDRVVVRFYINGKEVCRVRESSTINLRL